MNVAHAVHTRHNQSLLAAREKQVLVAIARRLPHVVHSDHLSALALVSMGVAAAGFVAMRGSPWGAVAVTIGLVLNWFGDSLDGTVARVRGHERPRFGYYVDHVIDLAGTALLLGGLALSGLMTPLLAVALLAAYLLVAGESFLATHASGVFRMSWMGMGPTELRLALIAGALYAAWRPVVDIPVLGLRPLFDVGAIFGTAGLVIAFVSAAVRQTRHLYLEEPRPSA
jgi:archaetidylinositol phosphate synthase